MEVMKTLTTKTIRENEIRKAIKSEMTNNHYDFDMRHDFIVITDSGWEMFYTARIEEIAEKILFDIRETKYWK